MVRVAVENHGPWICQSGVSAEINTDSAACALSFQRLRRGQFSRSVRVAFLLSTLAECDVYVVHRAGLNHPGDFDSRNATNCTFEPRCQVCTFAHELLGPTAQEIAHPSSTFAATIFRIKIKQKWIYNNLSLEVNCQKHKFKIHIV